MSEPSIKLPSLGPREDVYNDPYQKIYRVEADFGDFTKEYFVRDTGRRAGLVVVRGDSVLLVRQYRMLINGLSWEIPGGRIDDGETPEQAATRECLEETGIACGNLKPLVDFHPGLDSSYNPTFVFYSHDIIETGGKHPDPREVVSQEWVPIDRCLKMVFEHQIVDSLTMLSLLAYDKLMSKESNGA
jgi:8-oxo-dGTP pyrophosphatase MutT (NUDIX family)